MPSSFVDAENGIRREHLSNTEEEAYDFHPPSSVVTLILIVWQTHAQSSESALRRIPTRYDKQASVTSAIALKVLSEKFSRFLYAFKLSGYQRNGDKIPRAVI